MYPKHYQMCCRLCLGTSKEQLQILAVPELPEMLQMLYKLEISPGDKCSTRICVDCYYEAKVSCNWLRVHRKLKQRFEANQALFEQELKRQEAVPGKVAEPVENVQISCKICGITWKSKKLLRKHLSQQHQISRDLLMGGQRIVNTSTENNSVRCEICTNVLSDARSLHHHKLNVHKMFTSTCKSLNTLLEREPVKKVHRSRSTRAMEDYPCEPGPTERITRRSKSISSPVEMMQPSQQPPAFRTRSKSQDLETLLAEAASLKSLQRTEKSIKGAYRYFCELCGYGNGTKHRVVRHLLTEHNVPDCKAHITRHIYSH